MGIPFENFDILRNVGKLLKTKGLRNGPTELSESGVQLTLDVGTVAKVNRQMCFGNYGPTTTGATLAPILSLIGENQGGTSAYMIPNDQITTTPGAGQLPFDWDFKVQSIWLTLNLDAAGAIAANGSKVLLDLYYAGTSLMAASQGSLMFLYPWVTIATGVTEYRFALWSNKQGANGDCFAMPWNGFVPRECRLTLEIRRENGSAFPANTTMSGGIIAQGVPRYQSFQV